MNQETEATQEFEKIDLLIEKFLEESRRDPRLTVKAFVEKHATWANQLQELLPAALALESKHRPKSDSFAIHGPPLRDYRIIEELGRGGMGIVYKAEHAGLSRMVALKVLSPHLLPDAKARERFQREAKATAKLHHTNIVPVFEVGESDDHAYFTMQLIDGENLDERIKREAASTTKDETAAVWKERAMRAASLGVSIAQALQHAHDHEILHRDIKPSNILIERNDQVWLSDFGLASISDGQITKSLELVGTLRYLAPERLLGHCDNRSDIYSLGLTLYELVTMSPALGGLSKETLLNPHRHVPSLQSQQAAIPKDFATIIDKAIHSQPSSRYQTAAELADDLQAFLEGRPITARPVSSVEKLMLWAKRNPAIATLATSLNVILLAITIGSTLLAAKFRSLSHEANKARLDAIGAQNLAKSNEETAESQKVIAEKNERLAKRVSNYFARMIQGADPSGLFTGHEQTRFAVDRSTTAFDWIAQSAKLLESEDFTDAPLVEAELKDTLGVALTGQMRMDDAEPLLNRSLELRSSILETDHPDIAKSLDHLGTFHFYSGDPQSACEFFRKALDIRSRIVDRLRSNAYGSPSLQDAKLSVARSKSAYGLALEYSGWQNSTRAIELLRESLESRMELLGPEHEEVAYCHIALASVFARRMKSELATNEIVKAETILTKTHGDHRLTEVFSLYAQGTALQAAKLTDLAIDRFSRAEALMSELFGSSHPLTVYARGEVAGAMERGGHPEKAEAIYKRVIEFNQQAMAKQPFLGQSWDTLGICYRGQNKIPEAIESFEKALNVYKEANLLEGHFLVAMTKKRLADCMVIAGRIDEGYAMLTVATEALELQPKEVVETELATGLSYRSYLALWHQVDKFPEIVDAVTRVGKDETNPRVLEHLMNAGTRGHCTPEQAKILLAMNDRWLSIAKDDYSQQEAIHFRGRIFWQLGRYDEAIEQLQGKQRCERRRYQADLFISLCWKAKGDLEKAERLYLDAVNQIIPRLPVQFANNLRLRTTDRITAKLPVTDPPNPVEFHWEQTAYGEFAWRVLHQ